MSSERLSAEPSLRLLRCDQRFDALFKSLKSKITRAESAPWVAEDGTRLVRITQTEKKFTLVIDKRIAQIRRIRSMPPATAL